MSNKEFDDLFNAIESTVAPAVPDEDEPVALPKVPERKRTIVIDEAEGQSNFEVVGVNGVIHQIQRGIPVEVPESVVHVLRNAVGTRWVQTQNADGSQGLVPRQYSTIPWRLVD
jgi:hypothetical protein